MTPTSLRRLVLAACFACAATAQAQNPDPKVLTAQPAATLLLPYFEVDLSNPSGMTTQFSINNASATAVLAHVTVWSDLSVPVLAFNVYLTGYDVQRIDMRDVVNGKLPQTASAGQDPNDTISPKGEFSQDINFTSCNGILPPPPTLLPVYVSHLHATLTGKASLVLFGGNCAGTLYPGTGSTIARGYVTVDTVNNCSLRTPSDPGYFGASGDATNQNTLFGDFYFLQAGAHIGRGGELVHVTANATDPLTSTSGHYTFYGRYNGWSAIDNRQPLATTFAAPFVRTGAPFASGTSFVVWRDPKVAQTPFACPALLGTRPNWYPLSQEGLVVFDEQEHPSATLTPFPASTQKVLLGTTAFPIAPTAGWVYLDLNQANATAGANPPIDPAAAQAWVIVLRDMTGVYSVSDPAVMLDSATAPNHFVP